MKKFGFSRNERLAGKKRIEKLFLKGHSFQSGFFRVYWEESSSSAKNPAQLLIAVPKKKIKLATSRNRIKRMVREAYRLNKSLLLDGLNEKEKKIQFAIVFTANEIPVFMAIREKIILLLQRLLKEVNGN